MGSPLAPILANLFMGHYEKIWIENYKNTKPEFYRRYVDDVFCLFENKSQAIDFFHFINNQHENIKFTFEEEENNKLPFLDILIEKSDNKVKTSVYHKPTYTGLLTNFNSFVPFQYKLGLIRTLIDRTFRINNNWFSFDTDVKNLTKVLGRNCFPMLLINKVLKNYLHKQYTKNNNTESANDIDLRYFKLPYIGKHSIVLKQRIKDVMKKFCKNIDARLVFTTSKIKDSFSAKDKFNSFDHISKVIYKFVCASCADSYIGETERHLSKRIKEHCSDKNSHVFKHLNASEACKNAYNNNCFFVLDHADTKHQLRIKEGMYIKWEQPVLNKQLYFYDTSIF